MNRFVLPIAIFAALVALLAVGLTLDPREVPSPLIGKPAPHFELPLLQEAKQTLTERDMLGKVWILNVWASWCVSCREEHPVLLELAASGAVPETYVIDKLGVIRYKCIGPLTPQIVKEKVLPLVQELSRA